MKRKGEAGSSGWDSRYGEELMCANWNPVMDLIEWSCAKTLGATGGAAGTPLDEAHAEGLIGRIYSAGG